MSKKGLLNVRDHLDHLQGVIDLYRKYGDCPALKEEIAKLSVINRAIIRKHDAAKEAGSRKDIR